MAKTLMELAVDAKNAEREADTKLREAINGLCEACYVAEFLEDTLRHTDLISAPNPFDLGMANVIEDLRERIDKAMTILIDLQGHRVDEVTHD